MIAIIILMKYFLYEIISYIILRVDLSISINAGKLLCRTCMLCYCTLMNMMMSFFFYMKTLHILLFVYQNMSLLVYFYDIFFSNYRGASPEKESLGS
jgi:hypothetical protein